MIRSPLIRHGALLGALAGLAGGLAFGAAMVQLGSLPTVASLLRARTMETGFLVHMIIAAIVGAGFGMLVYRQRLGAGEMLFWGMTYGSLWWFLGPLTLLPLLLRRPMVWDVASAQAIFPSLIGHLWYGAVTAIAYVILRRRWAGAGSKISRGTILVGALAGVAGAWLFGRLVDGQAQWLGVSGLLDPATHRVPEPATILVGIASGVGFAVLYPQLRDSSGPMLIRGTMYGFAWWVAAALTLIPLATGMGLAWSVDAARARFPAFPGFLLSGAFLALVYRWVDSLARLLFSDMIGAHDEEGVGTRGLRALGRGAFAGLIGGLLFTIVMVRLGILPVIARLIGASSPWSGLSVHLVIAVVIGASFGLLFLRRSFDLGSALGWGVSYGFFWWILGPLTLLPFLLGTAPRWTAEIAGALIASLIGHLAYGAAVGVTFHLLEARYNPWWISDTDAEAFRTARRREEVLTSAPALWALVVVIALTLPVILTCGMAPAGSGYSMMPQAHAPGYESGAGPRSVPPPAGRYGLQPTGGYSQPSGRRSECMQGGSGPSGAPY